MKKISSRLTQKEIAFTELVATGMNQTDACEQAYDTKDRRSASVLASNVMKLPRIKERLAERDAKVSKILLDKSLSFHKMIESLMDRQEVAQVLVDNLRSKDPRVRDSALDKFCKLFDLYPRSNNINAMSVYLQGVDMKEGQDVPRNSAGVPLRYEDDNAEEPKEESKEESRDEMTTEEIERIEESASKEQKERDAEYDRKVKENQ